jgi:hypothetical protein
MELDATGTLLFVQVCRKACFDFKYIDVLGIATEELACII